MIILMHPLCFSIKTLRLKNLSWFYRFIVISERLKNSPVEMHQIILRFLYSEVDRLFYREP